MQEIGTKRRPGAGAGAWRTLTGWFAPSGLLLAVWLAGGIAEAKVQTKTVVYQHGEATLEGYLARPEGSDGTPRPGVIVVHDWRGVTADTRHRAEMLAEAGYVALAIDMYGQGVRPTSVEECAKQAGIYRADRKLMQARARAGLDYLSSQPGVEAARIAAIGYCFGGGTALELARSGAPLAGAVSFHGNLDTPDPRAARRSRGRSWSATGPTIPTCRPIRWRRSRRRCARPASTTRSSSTAARSTASP